MNMNVCAQAHFVRQLQCVSDACAFVANIHVKQHVTRADNTTDNSVYCVEKWYIPRLIHCCPPINLYEEVWNSWVQSSIRGFFNIAFLWGQKKWHVMGRVLNSAAGLICTIMEALRWTSPILCNCVCLQLFPSFISHIVSTSPLTFCLKQTEAAPRAKTWNVILYLTADELFLPPQVKRHSNGSFEQQHNQLALGCGVLYLPSWSLKQAN